MLTYTLDALRYREGALASMWLSLGATNLSLLYTTLTLSLERGVVLSLLTAVANGALLFMTGALPCTGAAMQGIASACSPHRLHATGLPRLGHHNL